MQNTFNIQLLKNYINITGDKIILKNNNNNNNHNNSNNKNNNNNYD